MTSSDDSKVVRLFEADRTPVVCLRETGGPRCAIEPTCGLKRVFQRAALAFYRELDAHSLADLLDESARLVELSRPSARRRSRS